MIQAGKNISLSRVLVMGITFKEDVSDIRNSKVADVIKELLSYGIDVDVVDPFADAQEVSQEYDITLSENYSGKYDSIILAVSHKQYIELTESDFKTILSEPGVIFDVKGIFRNKIRNIKYLSL
jgi:UDP-N-acetyl-D-galactosamine dehydrogenase